MHRLIQWLFYTPLVLGKTASFGGRYRGSRGCAPSGSRDRAPGHGVWGEAPRSWKLFVSQFFSEARAEIKRFDRFWRMMARNARNHARMSTTSQHYHLRKRTHDRQLPAHRGHLSDRNFVTRVLYKHTYWKILLFAIVHKLLTLLSLLY